MNFEFDFLGKTNSYFAGFLSGFSSSLLVYFIIQLFTRSKLIINTNPKIDCYLNVKNKIIYRTIESNIDNTGYTFNDCSNITIDTSSMLMGSVIYDKIITDNYAKSNYNSTYCNNQIPNLQSNSKQNDDEKENIISTKAECLCLNITNRKFLFIFQRKPALKCRGTIEFFLPNGVPAFSKPLPVRFPITPQPRKGLYSEIFPYLTRDIESGDSELIDVIVISDGKYYAWSNDIYPNKLSEFELSNSEYHIELKLLYSGSKPII